jgi:hypothetical protein
MSGALIVNAISDEIWNGRLFAEGADLKYDDPEWTCDHNHIAEQDALNCARAENLYRRYTSAYARMMARGETAPEVLPQLLLIDDLLLLTEQALDTEDADEDLAYDICNKIAIAFDRGMKACSRPHKSDSEERTP